MSSLISVSLLLIRVGLAAVFALAGVAKLADRAGSRRAMADLGVHRTLVTPAVVLLPLVELGLASALLLAPAARPGAAGAVVLLGTFSLLVARTLRRGEAPDCHCFGSLGGGPIGRSTLIRNGLLAVAAAVVLTAGPGHGLSRVGHWLGERSPAERVLIVGGPVVLVVVIGLCRMVMSLLGQQGRLLLRLDAVEALFSEHQGVPLGAMAPAFEVFDLDGRAVTLADLLAPGHPLLLIFADPYCGPCEALLPEVSRWQEDYQEIVTISVVSRGDPELNRAKARVHGLGSVLLQRDREVARLYRTTATPSAVLIDRDGRIAGPLVAGGLSIWRLLLRAPHAVSLRPPTDPWPRISDEIEVHQDH